MENIIFKQDYETEEKIKEKYEKAKSLSDTEGMEEARKEHQAFMEHIFSKDSSYGKLYQLFSEAMERGNQYIDLWNVIWEKDVEGLINSLRENGVEHFTFSSTWSSAVEIAWLFTQNGCTLEGMAQINGPHKSYDNKEYDTVPAYLFAVH